MNPAQYKMTYQRPDVFGRSVIAETVRLLPRGSTVEAKLQAILKQEPVPKPVLHQGASHTDYLQVNLPTDEAAEIASILLSAEAEAVSPRGDTTPEAAFIADLVDVWHRYAESKSG